MFIDQINERRRGEERHIPGEEDNRSRLSGQEWLGLLERVGGAELGLLKNGPYILVIDQMSADKRTRVSGDDRNRVR
jgi:hypothetical protein